jgi:hypothetical protein
MNFETEWTGEEKLVIAIDCGATQSEMSFLQQSMRMLICSAAAGVAYAHLLPQGLLSQTSGTSIIHFS